MRNRKQGGFTLVEVIVVAGIIAILAGVLIPLILKEIDESRISRAAADIRAISASLLILKKDTGKWPNLDAACDPALTIVRGSGDLPRNMGPTGWDSSSELSFDDVLMADTSGCYGARWKGPYMASVIRDPWGTAYILNSAAFAGNGPVWLLSAGPNGTVDTNAAGTALAGDDVGIRIR